MEGPVAEGLKTLPGAQRFCFRLAGPGDDAALRRLVRETPMDGPVRIRLEREPSYSQTAMLEGPFRQTLVAIDTESAQIVGCGSRSIRARYVEGRPLPVGYLSGLRIHPDYRGGTLLARGYREIRKMHGDGATDFYLTTIALGNQPAIEALTRRRAGLPVYSPLGSYQTCVIPLRRRPEKRSDGVTIRPLQAHELPLLVEFVREQSHSRLFLPCYAEDDFQGPRATFHRLAADDIMTAWRGSRLVATLALWDQSSFKQMVVEGYRLAIACARPLYNRLARCVSWPRFPAPGQAFLSLVAAVPLAAAGHEDVFQRLLDAAGAHARARYPSFDSLLVGTFRADPLFDICRRASLFRYETQVYLVYWDQHLVRPQHLAVRNPYLELGCL